MLETICSLLAKLSVVPGRYFSGQEIADWVDVREDRVDVMACILIDGG